MVGWIRWKQARGWRPSLERQVVSGLPLLAAAIPARPGMSEAAARRRVERAAKRLAEAGCRRTLVCPEFAHWPVLEEWGLCPVEAAPLVQALAGPLTLAALAKRGIPAKQAVVALCGHRANRSLFQAAEYLCPQVRQLIISAPAGGRELAGYLRAEYGVAVLEEGVGMSRDLTVSFSAGGGDGLCLCQPDIRLGGLCLRFLPNRLPEEVEHLPLLALLWTQGKIGLTDIEIISTETAAN